MGTKGKGTVERIREREKRRDGGKGMEGKRRKGEERG